MSKAARMLGAIRLWSVSLAVVISRPKRNTKSTAPKIAQTVKSFPEVNNNTFFKEILK